MDDTPSPDFHAVWRPEGCDQVALVLQGGGALGAYQAGVYQALDEAGLAPDRVAGVSIGAINAAIIAGNPRERRVERLRDFWTTITARKIWPFPADGDDARKAVNAWSSMLTMALGQPGFFSPHAMNAWLAPRGGRAATSFYDASALRETLLRLIDFKLLNNGRIRYAAGAVNVLSGNFAYFDSIDTEILPEHIMASGALPPALPMVQIGSDYFWDGGLVSNTPLQYLLETTENQDILVFQVDLFSASGALPGDMADVLSRQKDILYSSRTRLVTDYFRGQHVRNLLLKRVLDKVPESELDIEERAAKTRLASLPEVVILQLIYQQRAYEGQAKDYEFSATSMRDHWDSGYRDTRATLKRKQWLTMPPRDSGIVVHDIHRPDE
jgi:NTE family protein